MNTTPKIKAHTYAEVLVCLFQRLRISQKNSVRACWCAKGKLIQSQSFATSSDDAVSCNLGEAHSSSGYFGYDGQADVIGHCANLDNNLGREIEGLGDLLCDGKGVLERKGR